MVLITLVALVCVQMQMHMHAWETALCLSNNAIQLAKLLKVYKVTVLSHEKYIILYDKNDFEQMCTYW